MIGPHEGIELSLLLEGKKPLAAFSDYIPEGGVIDETIIPERAFHPHVLAGQIVRYEEVLTTEKGQLRLVCFALPGEGWRTHAYSFIRKSLHNKSLPYTPEVDVILGQLLGYAQSDIEDFIKPSTT